jgi:hypothetical protein
VGRGELTRPTLRRGLYAWRHLVLQLLPKGWSEAEIYRAIFPTFASIKTAMITCAQKSTLTAGEAIHSAYWPQSRNRENAHGKSRNSIAS